MIDNPFTSAVPLRCPFRRRCCDSNKYWISSIGTCGAPARWCTLIKSGRIVRIGCSHNAGQQKRIGHASGAPWSLWIMRLSQTNVWSPHRHVRHVLCFLNSRSTRTRPRSPIFRTLLNRRHDFWWHHFSPLGLSNIAFPAPRFQHRVSVSRDAELQESWPNWSSFLDRGLRAGGRYLCTMKIVLFIRFLGRTFRL